MLRGEDRTVFEIYLMSDLGEAHSKKVINLCNKYGIVKQATAGHTPKHNASVERWFRTKGKMSRCQLNRFNMEKDGFELKVRF
jgi:hypothetical protein